MIVKAIWKKKIQNNMSIFYVIESQKHYKCEKIIFKIYLKILRIKKKLNWIFRNNLLLVVLFLYQMHNN
jgi:hypothetical protein